MPSLFSAYRILTVTQVRDIADVLIFLVSTDVPQRIRDSFETLGVTFIPLPMDAFCRKADITFNRTHVPVTALGRLALPEVMPQNYEHIVYLDGDTYATGEITPLIQHTVAPGKVAAAADSTWLAEGQLGSFWNSHNGYLNSVGIDDARDYFNSGVLAFQMHTWRKFAPAALTFFEKNSEICRYHDQSALNATFVGQREALSPQWNFQSGYQELGAGFERRILHFTGGFKPWKTPMSVWGRAMFDEYLDFVRRYPELGSAQPESAAERGSYSIARRTLASLHPRNLLHRIRLARKRVLLRRYIARSDFAI